MASTSGGNQYEAVRWEARPAHKGDSNDMHTPDPTDLRNDFQNNSQNDDSRPSWLERIDAPSVVIAFALLAVLASMGVPQAAQYLTQKEAQGMSQSAAAALVLARNEAIRTGRDHVVLFARGAGDTAELSQGLAPLRILDDGRPGEERHNCRVDPGENVLSIAPLRELRWGAVLAGGVAAPGDVHSRIPASGSSFETPDGRGALGIVFRSDGVPRAFDEHCNIGPIGSGAGAVYFTNGDSDAAVVLAPMGGVSIHRWNPGSHAWRLFSDEQFAAELRGTIPQGS